MSVSLPTDEQLAAVVRSLPAAPRILAELAPRLHALDVDVPDVTAMLRRDSALTARLIDMANSAAFLGHEPATSIEEAVARVGFRETYRIVGVVASTQLADEPLPYYGINPQRLRENSLFTALVMEELSDAVVSDARTAYTVGLLRSIGKVVLNRFAGYHESAPVFDPSTQQLLDWERGNWRCTNADVAAHVLELWEFPEEAIAAVRCHYLPTADDSRDAHLLNLAAGAAELRGFGLPGEERYWRSEPDMFARAGVREDQLNWAAEAASDTLLRISPAFA